MLLIRGIKGETFARKIEKGMVDCRDVLSALLEPPVTGYEYSNYYEKNLTRALTYICDTEPSKLNDPKFLYLLLVDDFIPHVYLIYFHILNDQSLEWLDKFDDDYQFISINVKIDKITNCAIGTEYFGSKMQYRNSIKELKQDGLAGFEPACMCSIEHLFDNKRDMLLPLRVYTTFSFALLCREIDEKYTEIENEFRIIAYDCPFIKGEEISQESREVVLFGKSGVKYTGILSGGLNTLFESDLYALKNPNMSLKEILVYEQGMITLNSKFKAIDIREISDDYKYIGDKEDCITFIKKELESEQKDIYIDRTIRKQLQRDELSNYSHGKSKVNIDY